MNSLQFHDEMGELIDVLCERRALNPLRVLLPHYPMHNGLTDEWAELAAALKTVRVQHSNDLSESELNRVISLQHVAENALRHRS
jgi:hypothetical protein